ncbi:DUF1416 domain-containing protein [Jatrophihabitans sp. YIM 134969]
MCAPPKQTADLPAGVDLSKETVISGTVAKSGSPVAGAYVRLLDASGEFVAEVVSGEGGEFRFFAAPGAWTVSVLSREGSVRREVHPLEPGLVEVTASLD